MDQIWQILPIISLSHAMRKINWHIQQKMTSKFVQHDDDAEGGEAIFDFCVDKFIHKKWRARHTMSGKTDNCGFPNYPNESIHEFGKESYMYDHNERKHALVTSLVMTAVLLFAFLLPISAGTMRAASVDHPPLHRTVTIDVEDGKITDHDGIIGNSLHGADAKVRASLRRHMRHHHRHMKQSTDSDGTISHRMIDNLHDMRENSIKRAENVAGDADGVLHDVERGVDQVEKSARDAVDRQDGTDSENSENSENSNSTAVLGWVIAMLVVLAIALVVLAILPKKNRERG